MGRPPGSGKLAAYVGFFQELVAQDPDITLFELRAALADAEGVTVHHSAIASLLKRLGFTHKKSLVATERRRAKGRRQRGDWVAHRSPAIAHMPARVVFLGETAVKTNLTRLLGWAPQGRRLTMGAPFGSWGTQTLIAGLTCDALIAPWLIKGARDGPAFAAYIRQVLIPEIAPGTAVILDNLATHRNKKAAAALKAHGCWFLYLPPYSPDLDPIERAFSKRNAHLRKIAARSFTSVFDAIGAVCDLYEPAQCRNDFKAAG